MENIVTSKHILNVGTFEISSFDTSLVKDFRSDHAGEVGAVYIYKGILFGSNEITIRQFAKHHLNTETQHLLFFEKWLPKNTHSKLIPFWKVAGFILGYIPAKLGGNWVFVTISAVENFVVMHYTSQISTLKQNYKDQSGLINTFTTFCEDESNHLDDSVSHLSRPPNHAQKMWGSVINIGSRFAVYISRII